MGSWKCNFFYLIKTDSDGVAQWSRALGSLGNNVANSAQQTKNKVVLVDFWAEWCAPGKMMAPVLNDLADELSGNSHVGKLNIEQYQSMAQKLHFQLPTIKEDSYPVTFETSKPSRACFTRI